MPDVSLLLWDVGGVLLSNAWDHADRVAAANRFALDLEEFERRHDAVAEAFETGRIDLDRYLEETVFYVPRPFSPAEFRTFIRERSRPHDPALRVARTFRTDPRYLMVALNNESRELNEYRIATFHLRELFHAFLSSCYTGRRKPDAAAYRYALELTQRGPDEALFLDDRRENIDAAARLGLHTVWVRDADRVGEELAAAGVVAR